MKTKLTTLLCLLVMCLFVVASLVGCQGANGTDGKSAYQLWLDQGNTGTVQDFVNSLRGENGTDGVGIATVETNALGELVLTYTDGTVVNLGKIVIDAEPEVECDHEFKEYVMTAATCSEGGHVLNVCSKDCGYAYITYTELDPENHSGLDVESEESTCTVAGYDKAICVDCGWADEPVARDPLGHDYNNGLAIFVTAPTCEKDGCITATCQRCGDVEVALANAENGLLATGHDATGVWVTVVDEGANICIDGGQKLNVCATCFTSCTNCAGKILDAQKINPENHAVTADWTVSVEPTFTTKGELSGFCATCGINGTVELPALGSAYSVAHTEIPTCTETGIDTYTYTYKGKTVAFEVETSTKHVFNGEEMDLDAVYAPHDVEVVFGNAPASCKDASGKGSFTCDDCGLEYLVSVKGECVYDEDDVIAFTDSTCSSTGSKTYKCPTCGEEYTETIALKPHDYTGVAPTITGPSAATNDKVILGFDCNNCTHVKTIECDSYTTAVTPASCAAAGKTVYTYYYTEAGVPMSGTFEVEIPQLAHYYDNGTEVEIDLKKIYSLAELKAIFGDNLTDLTTFGNVFTDCSTAGQVAFTCSGCGVEFLFTATGDHTWAATGSTSATCETAGTITYTCSKNNEHTKTEIDVNAPAFGHNYVMDEDATNFETGKLVFVCDNDANHKLEINADDFDIVDTPATCLAGGSKVVNYTYTDPNTGLSVSDSVTLATYEKNNLHTYGATTTIDLNKNYTISQLKEIFGSQLTGLNFFGNFPTTCQADVPASFVCDVCAQDLLILHIRGDHDFTPLIYVDPTCDEDGYRYRDCQTAGCGLHEQVKTEDAIGHAYDYALTAPTADEAGKVVVTCTNVCNGEACDFVAEYEIPAKGDAAYTSNVDREATCQAVGQITYTFEIVDGEIEYTYSYSEEIPVVEHVDAVPPVEITWELDGKIYTGYFCGECNQMIVTNVVDAD